MQFQSAADELAVTPSALSYQIRQLEEFLQMKLFKRLNRSIELTSAGELIAGKIIDSFDKLEEAFALLQPDEGDRTLVISTGPAFSAKWLAPRLHGFLEEYDDIDFRMSASLKLVDFIADGIDAAIRFGTGNYPDLYVEPLFDEISTPLISPQLFDQIGSTASESLFEQVKLIHDDSLTFLSGGQWKNWLTAKKYQGVSADSGLRFNHADHCIEVAVDGGGIVMGRLGFAFREIKAGRLIAPFQEVIKSTGGFYFCCPHSAMEKEKVLHFLAWLRDEAEEQSIAIQEFMKSKVMIDS